MSRQLSLHSLRTVALAMLLLMAAAILFACSDKDDRDSSGGGDPATDDAPVATVTPTDATPANSPGSGAADAFRAMSIPGDLTDGYFLGDPAAPIQLVVFEDFQCPYCLQFTLGSEPEIVEKFVLTGKVRLEFRNLPILGQESAQAAFAAQCAADVDGFWALHKELFLAQYDAGQLTDEKLNAGRFSKDELVRHAGTAGLDTVAFEACLGDPATYDAVVQQARAANELGLRSTPSFLLNGQPLARYPSSGESWSAFLHSALGE